MGKLLLALLIFTVSAASNADWTDYMYDRDYVISYAFHKNSPNPIVKGHFPSVSFRGGSYSLPATSTCVEGNTLRTIEKKKICLQMVDEMKWSDDKEKMVKTGKKICGKSQSLILSKQIEKTKEICENRGWVINNWKKANKDEKYIDKDYPNCTLKRVVNDNSIITFKMFVAEKKNSKNKDDNGYKSSWGGFPLFTEMWTIPACY